MFSFRARAEKGIAWHIDASSVVGISNFWLVRSEHAHASNPGLFFRPPGFSPYMGREERRVQGLDYDIKWMAHIYLLQNQWKYPVLSLLLFLPPPPPPCIRILRLSVGHFYFWIDSWFYLDRMASVETIEGEPVWKQNVRQLYARMVKICF